MTDKHLLNRIKFFQRLLSEKPEEQHYMGESDFAEDCVNQENIQNEMIAESIEKKINSMISMAKERGIWST